jgi:fluoride ion exporter CrcB/FEX
MLTGILGAFTTFSTYMLESFDMLKDRKYKMFYAVHNNYSYSRDTVLYAWFQY